MEQELLQSNHCSQRQKGCSLRSLSGDCITLRKRPLYRFGNRMPEVEHTIAKP